MLGDKIAFVLKLAEVIILWDVKTYKISKIVL